MKIGVIRPEVLLMTKPTVQTRSNDSGGSDTRLESPVAVRSGTRRFNSVGWSLGSACPYSCSHCYSRSMRGDVDGLTDEQIRRVIDQLQRAGVGTVTLGGNEPIYTHGLDLERSRLAFIVTQLKAAGIRPALVTSGPSATVLARRDPDAFAQLDMVFVSLDAPDRMRHNANRGASLWSTAMKALSLCRDASIDRSILYCATRRNFTPDDIDTLVELARERGSRLRVNTLKPTGTNSDREVLSPDAYYRGFQRLVETTITDLVDEPILRRLLGLSATAGCPCGSTTFRISHQLPDGTIPVTPCIYDASARIGDLRNESLAHIVERGPFVRYRCGSEAVDDVRLQVVGGGCKAQLINGGDPVGELVNKRIHLPTKVVEDAGLRERFGGYLCTWIGRPA